MDVALLVGLLAAFGSLFGMLAIEGSSVGAILLPGPMLIVFGATIAVGIASGTIGDAVGAVKALPEVFRGKVAKQSDVIDHLVQVAEKARREGLLALEEDASASSDAFLKNALQNVADGTDSEELRVLLEDEISTRRRTRKTAGRWYKTLGGYAPTIGIIGTVVALTHVLANLSSPDKLGPMIASAFVATLWGLVSANFIWLPIGDRLNRLADLETERMNIILEGVLAIQSGAQPRLLSERLQAMVPDAAQQKKDALKAA
ncbi:MAG: motility protein A [Microbacteriaceae bacterium]|nr:MAG: motility protein A [Microbacteriaceae bacterium]